MTPSARFRRTGSSRIYMVYSSFEIISSLVTPIQTLQFLGLFYLVPSHPWKQRHAKIICGIQVPPSVLLDNLGNLLGSAEGADVKFKVKGEVYRAHKLVVALQSQVFKAQLYGPMSKKKMTTIVIEDMEPSVFKSLLHFMYKDS